MAHTRDDDDTIQGQHAKLSPCGGSVAFLKEKVLYCSRIPKTRLVYSSTPVNLRSTEISSIRWNDEETKVLVVSTDGAEVIDCTRSSKAPLCKLSNGSGGLGQLSSVEFTSNTQLLSIWEFGKTRLWNLDNSGSEDLPDVKTACDGKAWSFRPRLQDKDQPRLLALLSRTGPDDYLHLCFPSRATPIASVKAPTIDAQNLSWSPDGRWLALQDVTTACPCLHIYTPDGHLFRSHPPAEQQVIGLDTKSILWSSNSQLLALAKYDGTIELLNTRTFTTLATIEHTLTIDETSLPTELRTPIWQENVSASGLRSYTSASQPLSPPISQTKPVTEPSDLGIIESKFNSDGTLLATRDHRMLNTLWLWNTPTFTPQAVLIQHKNIRKLLWHPTRPDLLLITCAEEILYLYNPSSPDPPRLLNTGLRPKANLSWSKTPREAKPVILVAEKSQFRFLYPEGEPEDTLRETPGSNPMSPPEDENEEMVEDSIFEILSGHRKRGLGEEEESEGQARDSYTRMVELEVDAEEEEQEGIVGTEGLDDTFRLKREKIKKGREEEEVDPFDDSEIF